MIYAYALAYYNDKMLRKHNLQHSIRFLKWAEESSTGSDNIGS